MRSLEAPSYIHDEGEISKLLNRLGINSPKEIELFHMLCTSQQPVLPYGEVRSMTNISPNDHSFIVLMKQLQEKQVAILRHTITQGTLEPFYIRLCGEGSYEFLYEYVSETIIKAYIDPKIPLPTYNELRRKSIQTSRKDTVPFDPTIKKTASPEETPTIPTTDVNIYTIPIIKDIFFCTDITVNMLISICITRIQLAFGNSDGTLLNEVSKILDRKLSEIKEQIDGVDYHTWNEMASALYEQIDTLQQNSRVKHYPEFIDLILILHECITPQISHMQEMQDKNHQITEFIASLVDTVRTQGQEIESKTTMNALIDSTAQRYQLNTEEITEVLKTLNKKVIVEIEDIEAPKASSIIKIDTYYIHSDNIAPIISDRYFPLCEKLKEYYTALLYKYLTKKLAPKDIVFFNDDDLEMSIRQKALEYDRLFHRILKNPVFLANLIIQLSKKDRATENTTNVAHKDFKSLSTSRQLSAFFDLRTQLLLPWREIFNINLLKFTQDVYSRLGIFRKILLIFTGRYKSMFEKLRKINAALSPAHQINHGKSSNEKTGSRTITQ